MPHVELTARSLDHDSHLFDGVDGRQVIGALKVGAETASELGFQYIVTMNEDDAFKEKTDGFDRTTSHSCGDTFETNYTYGKYQFAFLAHHKLTMRFVYFNIWQIRQIRPEDFEKGLIGFGKDIEKTLLGATSPFVFSAVKERSILRFLKLIGCDNGKIGTYANLVDDRNETAHPNGNIFFSTQAAIDAKIAGYCAWWMKSRHTPGPSSNTPTASFCFRTITQRNASTPTPPTRYARC